MKEHYLLGEVSRVLGRKPHQIVHLLTSGKIPEPQVRIANKRLFVLEDIERLARHFLTVTDFGGIYRRPHVHSGIRWPQVLFQKQVIAKSLFLDLLTREAGKASHMTVNLSKEPLFEGQTGLSPQNP